MSYSLKELARASKTSTVAIQHYLLDRALPSPEFKGPNTRYTAHHLHWLVAMKKLRTEEGLTVKLAARRLHAMNADDVAVLAGFAAPAPAPTLEAALVPAQADAPAPRGPYRFARSEQWQKIVLAPGVELLVSASADAEAWRVAREIEATYAPRTTV